MIQNTVVGERSKNLFSCFASHDSIFIVLRRDYAPKLS